jgi:hypothetical protein
MPFGDDLSDIIDNQAKVIASGNLGCSAPVEIAVSYHLSDGELCKVKF